MNWLKLKLNRKLNGKNPGVIRVACDADGEPKERFWRDRIEDAKLDNCVEIIPEASDEPNKSKKSKEKELTDAR